MKIHKGMCSARIVTQVVGHYRHAVYQAKDAVGTMPAFGVSRIDGEPRTFHVMPVAAATGRKVKVLKSGTRRVTYK